MKDTLDTIAHLHLNIVLLDARDGDRPAVHEIGADALREVLSAAYYAGYSAAVRVQRGASHEALPTELHSIRGDMWLHAGPVTPADGSGAEAITTTPIPEVAFLCNHSRDGEARELLIPLALIQRNLGDPPID